MIDLRLGDCLEVLKTLTNESVQMCVTSPPYYGLRDYGTATWEGGDLECDHKKSTARNDGGRVNTDGFHGSRKDDSDKGAMNYPNICAKCGAVRVDNQIGLEETPEAYVAKLVEVFREVRRVLRDDGTLWLNLGDSYAGGGGGNYNKTGVSQAGGQHITNVRNRDTWLNNAGLKPKDLIGIPWRVAFALQADGWWLRQDIIFHKPNPMPESVTDRCTKSHEYIFLLTKSARYYYNAEAVKEPCKIDSKERYNHKFNVGSKETSGGGRPNNATNTHGLKLFSATRNLRDVWTITTKPFKEAHFATFPLEIPTRCIKAGTSEKGACSRCGAAWERIV